MANIINITEKNNRLEFSDTYTPIVCGNSNYVLKFAFSEQWQKCIKKAAFFVIDGNKLTVDFEGDECKVPVLPNAAFVLVSLVSGEKEEQLATTPIRIRLEPTMAGGDFSEFNQLKNYLPKILSALNAIENGEVVAKQAENAQTANMANNVVNTNILINGEFKVNQRGQKTYTEAGKYTVDRWKLVSGTVEVVAGGILLNGTIIQILEDLPKGELVASSNAGNISYSDGIFTINTLESTLISYAKLEIGTIASQFCSSSYAEELEICKRFYQKIYNVSFAPSAYYAMSNRLIFPVEMRTKPTSKLYPADVNGNQVSSNEKNLYDLSSNVEINTTQNGGYATTTQIAVSGAGKLTANRQYGYIVVLDAEIY